MDMCLCGPRVPFPQLHAMPGSGIAGSQGYPEFALGEASRQFPPVAALWGRPSSRAAVAPASGLPGAFYRGAVDPTFVALFLGVGLLCLDLGLPLALSPAVISSSCGPL